MAIAQPDWQQFKRMTPRQRAEWAAALPDRALAEGLNVIAQSLVETDRHDPCMTSVLFVKEAARRLGSKR